MYGEDLDICLRIKKLGFRNYYYPGTNILHFKGQSCKTRRFRTFVEFYMAMLIFAKKHHNYHLPTFVIALGICFAALVGVFSRLVPQWWKMVVDLLCVLVEYLAFSRFVPLSGESFLVMALSTWIPLSIVGDYVSPRLDGRRLLKFLLPFESLGVLFASFVLGEKISVAIAFLSACLFCVFWRRLLFGCATFTRFFGKGEAFHLARRNDGCAFLLV